MREPGPDHPITVTPSGRHVVVRIGGQIVAESDRALVLQETTMPPVFYIPREDARMDLMTRTNNSSTCPYKGVASYYSVTSGDRTAENAVWSYETPYHWMSAIAGHLAFYPNRVDAIEAT